MARTAKKQTLEESLQEIGRNAYARIVEQVKALRAEVRDADGDVSEIETDEAQGKAQTEIQEDVLSVRVRDGWRDAGQPSDGPEEYELLLSTGGPATRIVGTLNGYSEPETARLEAQDWGTPWTEYVIPIGEDSPEATLLAYAQCFLYGLG